MSGPPTAWFAGLNQKDDEASVLAVYPNGTGSRYSSYYNGGNELIREIIERLPMG